MTIFGPPVTLATPWYNDLFFRARRPPFTQHLVMFDSVLEQNIPRRPLGRGALLSIAVHVALVALALYVSSRPKLLEKKERIVTFLAPPPPPPPPPPAGGSAKPKVEHKTIVKPKDTVVPTKRSVETPPETPKPEPAGVEGGVVGGVAGGVVGGVVGGIVGGQLGSTGATVIPFGAGMEKPQILVKTPPTYTREAAAMQVSGVALVKCIINLDGSLTDCRIMKGLPYMDKQILESLRSWKYTPVMYQGHPQRVEMIIPYRVSSSG